MITEPIRNHSSSWRAELLRLAAWRASRSGLDDALLSPVTGRPEQAAAVAAMLLDHAGDALADAGDSDTAAEFWAKLAKTACRRSQPE